MRLGELFAGYGGLGMGVELAIRGIERAWVSEFDAAPSKVLKHHWPDVPNLGDITKIDWHSQETVDVLTGGFPCQDVSLAGARRGMGEGTRSGLWVEMARAIEALRPQLVVIENVRGLLSATAGKVSHDYVEPCQMCMGNRQGDDLRALGAVLGDLADLGFDAEWSVLAASAVGAPHRRERVFIVAWPTDTDGHLFRELCGEPFAEETGPKESDGLADTCGGSGAVAPLPAHAGRLSMLPTPKAGDADFGLPTTSGRPASKSTHLAGRLAHTNFGDYAPVIERWERVLGRDAPEPLTVGPRGGRQLSPLFVEWLMGLSEGHVTAPEIGLTRTQQLRALGNGVVPLQAALAIQELLKRALKEEQV